MTGEWQLSSQAVEKNLRIGFSMTYSFYYGKNTPFNKMFFVNSRPILQSD